MLSLIKPHGGSLTELLSRAVQREDLRHESINFPSIFLSDRQLCDIELLLSGAFSPLTGFLNQADYDSVVERMRLSSGLLWPIPITLDINEDDVQQVGEAHLITLRDVTGLPIAVLHRGDLWKPDKKKEALQVFGTDSHEHPAVDYLMRKSGIYYLGGDVEGIQMPPHYDFHNLRHTPRQLRAEFEAHDSLCIVAFQTRNPMHRAHKELTDRAARDIGGDVLIHPVVGLTKPGDIDHFTRVRTYKKLLNYYSQGKVFLSLLQLAMRMAGPREALLHAIIRKNYGCTHLIIGRDHAGPGAASNGQPFYGPYQAQDLVKAHIGELGIEVVPFQLMVYVPATKSYQAIDQIEKDEKTLSISGTQLRSMLQNGEEIPEWFSYKEIIEELQKTYPAKSHQGFAIFLTGLSGSGKSTIANALQSRLLETLSCPITLLDGDIVRTNLSKGLGFTKEDRSINVQRIGYVASEIVKHRGIVICAPIAPYHEDRIINRRRIEREGGYIEVFVNASLQVCERRDVKGLYAKARAGLIKGFTGIDDPYEVPEFPEVICNTELETVEESIGLIMKRLKDLTFLFNTDFR